MKTSSFLLLLSLLCSTNGYSQSNSTIEVKNKSLVTKKTLSSKSSFLDSSFYDGIATYKNGEEGKAIMNYQLLDASIYFVDKNKNIMQLAGLNNIQHIKYGNHFFSYTQNYGLLEQIKSYSNGVELYLSRKCTINNTENNNGAYGLSSVTSAVDTYKSFIQLGKSYNIESTTSYMIDVSEVYFIKINEKYYKIKSTKDITKLFPNKIAEIAASINSYQSNSKPEIVSILDACLE